MNLRQYLWALAILPAIHAQPVVAPSAERPGSSRGENTGNYNVTNSFETGYRFAVIGGDAGMYRADVNYGNGIRLLGSNLTVNSRDGHGRLFDEIVLNTTGLGNDPYEFANIRIQKNGLYRYDATWRSSDYYNQGLVISGAQHFMNTQRHMQDHEVRFIPSSRLQFRFGYARNDENGPALSTEQGLNNATLSVLPLFRNVRRDWNEYRLGADFDFLGFKLTLLRQWDFYKDDSAFTGGLNGIPAIADNQIGVTRYIHAEPYHGSNPGWLGNLNTSRKLWALNARMAYVSGRRDFLLNESSVAPTRQNPMSQFQTVVAGNGRRPAMTGDFSLSIFPTSALTLVANNSVQSYRIDGDASIVQLSTFATTMLNFQYLGIRTVATSLDANYRLSERVGFYAAYDYSTRLIRTVENMSFAGGGFPGGGGPGPGGGMPPGGGGMPGGGLGGGGGPFGGRSVAEQNNHLNIGRLGLRIKPVGPLTVMLDGEIGRDNHPFLPSNDRDYHTINGRVEYRARRLRLMTAYRQHYNINSPVSLSFHVSHARSYSANGSWSLNNAVGFDANYTKLHLDTAGTLAFYAGTGNGPNFPLQRGYTSIYLSNIHSINLGSRFAVGKRVSMYLAYNLTKDTGDGRERAVGANPTNAIQQVFSAAQTFPLSYQAPMARISIRLRPKLSWNAGWQFYRYRQRFSLLTYLPNYQAQTGYTSISWSF